MNGYPVSWSRVRGKNVYLQTYSNLNQVPANTNATLATCENVSAVQDITFDGVGTYTFQTAGVYFMPTHSQVAKTGGAGIQRVSMWFQLNGVVIDGSAVTNSVSASPNDLRVVRNLRIQKVAIGDQLQVMFMVESSGVGLGLYAQQFGAAPIAPSFKLTMSWIPT